MKAILVRPMIVKDPKTGEKRERPAGWEIEHADAWRLVENGVATPGDDECARACRMTQDQIDAALLAGERLSKGIHPNDFDIYKAGIMDGYTKEGHPAFRGQRVSQAVIEEVREKLFEQASEEGIDPRKILQAEQAQQLKAELDAAGKPAESVDAAPATPVESSRKAKGAAESPDKTE